MRRDLPPAPRLDWAYFHNYSVMQVELYITTNCGRWGQATKTLDPGRSSALPRRSRTASPSSPNRCRRSRTPRAERSSSGSRRRSEKTSRRVAGADLAIPATGPSPTADLRSRRLYWRSPARDLKARAMIAAECALIVGWRSPRQFGNAAWIRAETAPPAPVAQRVHGRAPETARAVL